MIGAGGKLGAGGRGQTNIFFLVGLMVRFQHLSKNPTLQGGGCGLDVITENKEQY